MTNKKGVDIESLFNEAISLREKGEYVAALLKFENILNENRKSSAMISGLMGHIHYILQNYDKAIEYYQKSVFLSPKSELASLGLFHSLWDSENYDEALAEAKRFMSIRESEEYIKMIEEMGESFRKAGIDISQ